MSGEIVHVASVSGGKDSTGAYLALIEMGIAPRPVFFDVGWDDDVTYEHLDYLERAFGVPIERRAFHVPLSPDLEARAVAIEALIRGVPSPFVRLCLSKGMFPSRTIRFCTQSLKMFVAADVMREEHLAGRLPVNVIGVRADESEARSRLPEREISALLDCEVWRPILKWTIDDVIAIHRRHGIKPNPLYLRGFSRVGCYPCIMANKGELRQVAKDPRRVMAMRALEAAVEDIWKAKQRRPFPSPPKLTPDPKPTEVVWARDARGRLLYDADGEKIDTGERVWKSPRSHVPPTLFQRARKEADGQPCIPIDEHLAWANTADGAAVAQGNLFDEPEDPNDGCMRWGMCEAAGGIA